jgi:integrase
MSIDVPWHHMWRETAANRVVSGASGGAAPRLLLLVVSLVNMEWPSCKLDITTTFHKLRHYSATELITGGVDVHTVARRRGQEVALRRFEPVQGQEHFRMRVNQRHACPRQF